MRVVPATQKKIFSPPVRRLTQDAKDAKKEVFFICRGTANEKAAFLKTDAQFSKNIFLIVFNFESFAPLRCKCSCFFMTGFQE